MTGISLRQLEVFVSIAATGTVRAAAERLHVTQPAISMALAELERQLSTTLFNRERGRLYLSLQGKELLPQAQEILERVYDLEHYAAGRTGTLRGELRLGTSNTIGNYLVGDLLSPFITTHPQVSLHLSVENTRDIIQRLLDYELDVACVEGPVSHPQLQQLPWREDTLAVCAAPDHPLARQATLTVDDFRHAKWILREPGSAMRIMAERALSDLPPGQIFLELGQVESIKQAVMAGLGISWLPDVATVDAVAAGRLVRLNAPFLELTRRVSLILHQSRYPSAILRAFMDSLELSSEISANKMTQHEGSQPPRLP